MAIAVTSPCIALISGAASIFRPNPHVEKTMAGEDSRQEKIRKTETKDEKTCRNTAGAEL